MRIVVATIALVFSAAMLLRAGTALPAFAAVAPSAGADASASVEPSATVAPSPSVEASGSPLPDAVIDLIVNGEGDPAQEWTIAVTGGSSSVQILTLEEVVPLTFYGAFTVAVSGPSAIVEMTAALPSGWGVVQGGCLELHKDPPGELDALVPPRRLVIEVVQGGDYECFAYSDSLGALPDPTSVIADPTVPPTDSLAGPDNGSKSDDWTLVLAAMAALIAASLLMAVSARHRS